MTQFVMPRQVETIAALRAMTKHRDKSHAFIRPSRDFFIFDAADATADDGLDTIKPTDVSGSGRYKRFLPSQELMAVSVKSYGATGDGVTDDTAAVQAAMDKANASGRPLYFPPGTYLISDSITLSSTSLKVCGAGYASIIDIGTNAIAAFKLDLLVTPSQQIEHIFEDLFIKGDDATPGQQFLNYKSGAMANYGDRNGAPYMSRVNCRGIECYFYDRGSILPSIRDCILFLTPGGLVSDGDVAPSSTQLIMFGVDCDHNELFDGTAGGIMNRPYVCGDENGICIAGGWEVHGSSMSNTVFYSAPGQNKKVTSDDTETAYNRCLFGSGTYLEIDAPSQRVIGCLWGGTTGNFPVRCVDITANGDGALIHGNTFTGPAYGTGYVIEGSWTSEAIRNAAKHCVISGNRGAKVVETGAADFNTYHDLDNVPTLLGAASRIGEANHRNVRTFGAIGDNSTNDRAAIQAAIDGLPTIGGTVYFPPGTYRINTGLTLPDKEVTFEFAGGASITIGTNAITVFTVPDGLTARRNYDFRKPVVTGGSVTGQKLFTIDESNSRGVVRLHDPEITGIEIPFNVTDGEAAYVNTVEIYVCGGRILPTALGTNVLIQTANPAGTYPFGCDLWLDNVWLEKYGSSNGWSFDYDGDLIVSNGVSIRLKDGSANKIDGLQVTGALYVRSASGTTLKMFGASFWSEDDADVLILDGVTMTVSTSYGFEVRGLWLYNAGSLVIDGPNVNVNVKLVTAPGAIGVDITTLGTNAKVSGNFGDHTTAAIRNACAAGPRIHDCSFASTGGHKTIQDTGAGDYTLGVGNKGVSTGGGMTLGGNSKVTVGDYNFA